MAAGFIWLHRDGHIRVPHFPESLLDDVLMRALPGVDEKLMRNYQVLCCHVHGLSVVWAFWCDASITGADAPYTSVLLTLASSRFLNGADSGFKKSLRGLGSKKCAKCRNAMRTVRRVRRGP